MDFVNTLKRQSQSVQFLIRWLVGLKIVFVLSAVFAQLAKKVWLQESFRWDAPFMLAIHHLGNPTLDVIMRWVTQTGGTGAVIIAILLAAWLIWKHRRVESLFMVIGFGGAAGMNSLLKLLFARPRPNLFPPLVVESSFSFPSGHVTASVAVYGLLAVLLWQNKHRVLALMSGAWIFMVAISRIYLGVHYPSDTLAAIAFTSLWLIAVFFIQGKYLQMSIFRHSDFKRISFNGFAFKEK